MDIPDHGGLSERGNFRIAAFNAKDRGRDPGSDREAATKGEDSETSRSLATAVAFGSKLEYYALMAVDLEFISAEAHQPYLLK